MKLRQKLAMVLATAMIVTAVPVVTFADSTNRVNQTVSSVDGTKVTVEDDVNLIMDFGTSLQDAKTNTTTFYLTGQDFDLDQDAYAALGTLKSTTSASYGVNATITFKAKADDNTVRVTVTTDGTVDPDAKLRIDIPVLGKIKKGSPAIVVDPLDSYTTGGKYYITKETVEDEKKLAITAADAAVIPVDGGILADVTIEEKEENALRADKAADREVTFKLPSNSDLEFTNIGKIKLEGKRAFAGIKVDANVRYAVDRRGNTNYKEIIVTLPDSDTLPTAIATTTGKWVLSNLEVEPDNIREEASLGDVIVNISGEMLTAKDYTLGKVAEYDVKFSAKEVVELISGKGSKEVVVTLQEGVKESLDDKRWALFELPEGAYIKVDEEDLVWEGKPYESKFYIDATKVIGAVLNGDAVAVKTQAEIDEFNKMVQLITNKDGNVTGFKVQFEYANDGDKVEQEQGNLGKLNPAKANKIDFKFNVQADTETTGAIKMTATSKAFEVEPVQVANVTAPVEVSFDQTTVKVGLESQKLGKVTVKETDKGMLERGELVIGFDEPGVTFVMNAKDLKITTPEGSSLKVEVDEVTKSAIILNVERTTKEVGEFTIEGIVADIDRTVPEGKVAVEVYGDSLRQFDGVWFDRWNNQGANGHYGNSYEIETNDEEEFDKPHKFVKDGYIVVGTKNTEDLPNAAKAKEIILTVNSTEYTVNGEAKKADAAAYIDANNRTMVPVKFVAEEFGRIEFGTINGVGTVTVFKDGDVLQFQNGSNIMNKNGIAIPMDTTTVIKDGRTYVPFKYVAQGLGISFSFDAATKSITFTNQVK